jgi:large-conductance mechanosensitive channel
MEKRGKPNFVSLALPILILIVFLHTTTTFVADINDNQPLNARISGLATGKISLYDSLKTNYRNISALSKFIIAGEWMLVISVALFILIKARISLRKDEESLGLSVQQRTHFRKDKSQTDIDVLYSIIKEKKAIRLPTISKIFGVKEEIAMGWCESLESGNLVDIRYPTIGGAEISLNEMIENEKDKK